jgi:hypothetical protein
MANGWNILRSMLAAIPDGADEHSSLAFIAFVAFVAQARQPITLLQYVSAWPHPNLVDKIIQ